MSGGIESGEFAQSLTPVIDTFKVPIPKSSQTVGEITGVRVNLTGEFSKDFVPKQNGRFPDGE